MRILDALRHVIANSDKVVRHSDGIEQGIANQSDLLNRKFGETIDLLDHKFGELIDLQKAALVMQREQAESLEALTAAIDELRGRIGESPNVTARLPAA